MRLRIVKLLHCYIVIFIVAFAAFLRFYRLGEIPLALDWDEVSLGYNAWSLLETGRDEFGNSWPLSIRSFGDYKPPLYTYLLIPSLKIFGRTDFAIRFPSALAGTLTVVVTYFLTNEFVKKKFRIHNSEFRIGGISAFFLAISPWHLQFSRIAFEANVALFLFVGGMWLLIRSLRKLSRWLLFFSVMFMSLSLMAYHSARIVVPLIVLTTLWIYKRDLLVLLRSDLATAKSNLIGKFKLPIILSTVLTILTILTIFYTIFFQGVGRSRFNETSFLTIDDLMTVSRQRIEKFDGNFLDRAVNHRFIVYAKQFAKGYLDHYAIKFWFLDGDRIDRHRAPGVGLLYWWELPLLVMGLMSLMGQMGLMATKEKTILFLWLLMAPVASALTGGTPSAVRSLLFLPTFQIIEAIGLIGLISQIRQIRLIKSLFFGRAPASNCVAVGGQGTPEPRTRALATHGRRPWEQASVVLGLISIYSFFASFETIHYFHQYYVHLSLEYAPAWQYGYKQLVSKIMGEKDNYDKIIVTTAYDQPYIYLLWYGGYDPKHWKNDGEFNKRFDKFEFRKIEWDLLSDLPRIMVISSPDETKGKPVKWKMDFPDGKTAFNATEL